MPFVDVDAARETFDHQCAHCGAVRSGLRLDPARGDWQVHHDVDGTPAALVTAPCAAICRCHIHTKPDGTGTPCHTVECFNLALQPHDAGLKPHPNSLVGQEMPGGAPGLVNVVSEHWVYGSREPFRIKQIEHILACKAHPVLAPHLAPKSPAA